MSRLLKRNSIFWSEKKAYRFLLDKLYQRLSSEPDQLDQLDQLAGLLAQAPFTEDKFRAILRELHWSPRQIRRAVDTIKYGRVGAGLSFHTRRLVRNNRATLLVGGLTIWYGCLCWLSPIMLVCLPLLLFFHKNILPSPEQLPPAPEPYLLPAPKKQNKSNKAKRSKLKNKKTKTK